jgi:ethanolamine utilization protein EutA (predicted chaperonin)
LLNAGNSFPKISWSEIWALEHTLPCKQVKQHLLVETEEMFNAQIKVEVKRKIPMISTHSSSFSLFLIQLLGQISMRYQSRVTMKKNLIGLYVGQLLHFQCSCQVKTI